MQISQNSWHYRFLSYTRLGNPPTNLGMYLWALLLYGVIYPAICIGSFLLVMYMGFASTIQTIFSTWQTTAWAIFILLGLATLLGGFFVAKKTKIEFV